jgi:3-deoxy-D-manno-octulosonate 8-phosphate phosphatase (KDO 8-P phosphatase)
MLMNEILIEKFKKIKLLLLDVDGVLTDGGITYSSNGEESVTFHVHDGFGIVQALKRGFQIGIITGRDSEAVKNRINVLGIKIFYKAALNKIGPYEEIKKNLNLDDKEIAYIGDDIPDIPILQVVGLPIAPINAIKETKKYAEYITETGGGHGAVREVIDAIFKYQGINLLQ